jgi:prepilin-type N-terminal cleavage/methylation domain-containing protein
MEPMRQRRRGFSLVEMLVALSAASILALTMGAMMWSATLSWKRTGQSVELQRDMRASMDVITRMARSATNMLFTTGLVYTAQFSDRSPMSVYVATNRLYLDPNTTVANNEVRLTAGLVNRFAVQFTGRTAIVTLSLRNNDDVVSNLVVLTRRN